MMNSLHHYLYGLALNNGFRLSILARDEVDDALVKSVTHAVSLVDPHAWLPSSLGVLAASRCLTLRLHDALDSAHGQRAPTRADIDALCNFADRIDRRDPVHLLVHCHEGRSRSSAAAAILLVRLSRVNPKRAFDMILKTRCPVWPNWTMIEHGDAALSCGGALTRACLRAYAEVSKRHPVWVDDPRPENAMLGRMQ